MIGNAPISPLTGVPGWLTNAEEEKMYELAQKFPEGTFLEIGSEWGRSTAIWAKATQETARIFAIDLRFEGDLAISHMSNMEEAGFIKRIAQIAGDSKVLAQSPKFRSRRIDLIFIDGDHTEEGAYIDLSDWSKKLKVGGYVLVHDCACLTNKLPHATHYDVLRAVQKWQSEVVDFELVGTVDTLMIFRRV